MKIDMNHPLSRRCKVLLNGQELTNAVAADDVAGTVETVGEPTGKKVWTALAMHGDPITQTTTGTVRLVFNPPLTDEERERYGAPVE